MLFVFILAMAGMRCTRADDPSQGPFRNARAFVHARHPERVEIHVQCATSVPNPNGTINCGVDWIENGVHVVELYRCRAQETERVEDGCVLE